MNNQPPKFFLKLFRWYCHPNLVKPVEGDLMELYDERVRELGKKHADWKFIKDVILLFRKDIIKPMEGSHNLNHYGMFKNFFKVSYRNLIRYKLYTLINILGFTLGIGVTIILYWIVRYEKSFDGYHTHADNTYQIMGVAEENSGSQIPGGLITRLNDEFPEVELALSVHRLDPNVIRVGTENLKMENSYFVDPRLFELLDIEWLVGSPETALKQPNQVVIDESTARRLFSGEDPIGQTIVFDNELTATVSGIIKDVPPNTEFPLKMIFPLSAHPWTWIQNRYERDWGGGDSAFKGLVKLKENVNEKIIASKISAIAATYDEFEYDYVTFEPINTIHSHPNNDPFNYYSPSWLLDWLLFIALFILVIASINFINLSTAHAVSRNKAIVLRKILGSSKLHLFMQFLTETGILVFVSMFLAIGFAGVIVDSANQFFETNISLSFLQSIDFALSCIALWAIVTILSGIYPSIVISNGQLLSYFRRKTPVKRIGLSFRQFLISFQFVITQIMIVAIFIGIKQMDYLFSKELGFNHGNVIVTPIPEQQDAIKRNRFRETLSESPLVTDLSFSQSAPSASMSTWWGYFESARFSADLNVRIQFIDENYLNFYDLSLLSGRNFLLSDTSQNVAIINRNIVNAMGYTDPKEAIGQNLAGWPGRYRVIGVIEDYHSESLKEKIIPQIMIFNPQNFYSANIKIGENSSEAISLIRDSWTEVYADYYFEYGYLSDRLKGQYSSDKKFTNFLGLFAAISILIGSLGLYGLVYFVCLRKTKEIGIRKALGAELSSIVTTLSKGLLRPVLVSIIVSIPVILYVIEIYLSNYAFRVTIEWYTYLFAGLLTIFIASLPVLLQARHAGQQNPVESLRDE